MKTFEYIDRARGTTTQYHTEDAVEALRKILEEEVNLHNRWVVPQFDFKLITEADLPGLTTTHPVTRMEISRKSNTISLGDFINKGDSLQFLRGHSKHALVDLKTMEVFDIEGLIRHVFNQELANIYSYDHTLKGACIVDRTSNQSVEYRVARVRRDMGSPEDLLFLNAPKVHLESLPVSKCENPNGDKVSLHYSGVYRIRVNSDGTPLSAPA